MRPEFETLLREIVQAGQTAETQLENEIIGLDYSKYLSPSGFSDFERKLVHFFYDLSFGNVGKFNRLPEAKFSLYHSFASKALEESPRVSHHLNVIRELYDEVTSRGGMRNILRLIEEQIRSERIRIHTRSVIDGYLDRVSKEQKKEDAICYAKRYPMSLTAEAYQKDLPFYVNLYFEGILKNHYFLIRGFETIGL